MADEQTAGTPGATQEGAAQGGGTPVDSQDGSVAATVDADELKKLRDIREQFLREKDNTERIRQENEMLRQQMEQASRASMPPTGYDPAAQQAARIAQAYQGLSERDPETAELIAATARITQEQIQRNQAEQRFYRELGSVPSEDQAEVEQLAKSQNLWPSIAYGQVKARRYDKERNELAEQRRKLQEQEDKIKRGVVRTDAAPSPPASTNQNTMTRSEFAQVARAAALGSPDAKKRMDDYDEGRIRLMDG